MAVIPEITAMLKMLEPITLPTATSLAPLSAAEILTVNSGALVPNATMVRPMIRGGIPKISSQLRAAPDEGLRADI